MEIKELAEKLGITKEGATEQDIIDLVNSANAEKEKIFAEYNKDKKLLSDRNSEIAKLKKEADAKKTDEEKHKEYVASLEQEIGDLKKANQKSVIKNQYLSGGFSEEEASKIADSMIDGKTDEVARITNEHIAKVRKEVEAQIVKNTPHPSGSNTNPQNGNSLFTKENFRAGMIPMEKLAELQKQNPALYDTITK